MSKLEEGLQQIRAVRPRRMVVLTGPGISGDSGIPTFRAAAGTPPIVEAIREERA